MLTSDGVSRRPVVVRDGELDLRECLLIAWRYRVAIVALTILASAVAAAIVATTARRYAAQAVLAINQSKIGAGSSALTTASYRPILESQNLATKVVREFGLDRRGYSATGFFGSVVTIDEVRNATAFVLHAELDDPNLAARVVNRTAELAVEQSKKLTQQEALRTRDDLNAELDDAERRMHRAQAALVDFRNSSQIELLRQDVDSMLEERGNLLTLLVNIEAKKAELAAAERELATRHRVDTVERSIDRDPALMESASRAAPQQNVLGLGIKEQAINSVYQRIDDRVAEAKAALAGLEREKQQLVDVRKLDAPRLAQLTRLYDTESQLSKLQIDADLARAVYQQIATAYQTAQLQVSTRSSELALIEPALPPDRPVARELVKTVAITFAIALIFSVLAAIAYDLLKTPSRQNV